MDKRLDLRARNFPTAQEDAALEEPSRYEGPESAYRLAFTDTEFLLRDELRPVRMQLELLKPEMVQARAEHRVDDRASSAARASCPPTWRHSGWPTHDASGDAAVDRARPRCSAADVAATTTRRAASARS